MAPFLVDSFTDTNGTNLAAHTPDTGGAWQALDFAAGGGTPNQTLTIQNNRACPQVVNSFPGSAWHRNAADPVSAEFDHDIFSTHGTASGNCFLQIAFRMTPTGTAYADVDFYEIILNNTLSQSVTLNKVIAGVSTQLATASYALASATHAIRIECRDATKKVFIGGVEILSTTDNAITQVGRIGLQTRRSRVGFVDYFDSLSVEAVSSGTSANAGAASASGTAQDATTASSAKSADAGSAAASGVAYDATASVAGETADAGVASSTGSAHFDAGSSISLELTADNPIAATATAGVASAAVSASAAAASASGTAHDATVSVSEATDAAAGVASATAAAHDSTTAVASAAGLAVAAGSAHDVTVSAASTASADAAVAQATGQGHDASVSTTASAGAASATGTAHDATTSSDEPSSGTWADLATTWADLGPTWAEIFSGGGGHGTVEGVGAVEGDGWIVTSGSTDIEGVGAVEGDGHIATEGAGDATGIGVAEGDGDAGFLPPLTFTATPIHSTRIDLAWSIVDQAAFYEVERQRWNGTSWVDSEIIPYLEALAHSDTTVIGQEQYRYRIRSVGP